MKKPVKKTSKKKTPTKNELDQDLQLLIQSVKKKPRSLRDLCDEVFHCAPSKVEALVEKAKKLGYTIALVDSKLDFKPAEQDLSSKRIPVNAREESFAVGIISDIHFGSKYCIPEAVVEHIKYCYDQGIRDILCTGDLLEGCYKHARFELSHVGWEDQAQEALDHLPQLPGLRYFFIDGNHDYTFTDQIGVESGKNLVRLAKEQGRNDITFLGSRGALIDYGGTKIELWHPKKGLGYALSYGLQNHIRDADPENRPHILLAGHWHRFVTFREGGVCAVACATFQHGDTPFGRSLGGATSIGGIVMRWSLSNGQIKSFNAEYRAVPYKKCVDSVIPRSGT